MKGERPSYKTFGKRRSLRLPGFDYRQQRPYHLTWGTYRKRPLLARTQLAREIISVLKVESELARMIVYAYCLMPDHVHVLVRPSDELGVVQWVQRFKSRTTRCYWGLGGRGRLWQRGFYDRVLRENEPVRHVAKYILGNPVRAGIAESIETYPFSGSFIFDPGEL